MKNLIMGVAKGYDWYALEPFVTSCKKFCPDAELVLFVDDISDFTRNKLIHAGVTLEQFPDELKSGIPNNTRWKILADYLAVHVDDYAQVFITDTRDVIFQGDVFAPFKAYTNWLGYATELPKIGEELNCSSPKLTPLIVIEVTRRNFLKSAKRESIIILGLSIVSARRKPISSSTKNHLFGHGYRLARRDEDFLPHDVGNFATQDNRYF